MRSRGVSIQGQLAPVQAPAQQGSAGRGVAYVSESEAKESAWYRKNMGLLRDTLRAQLKERSLDANGSKEVLAIRLAQHQMGIIRMQQ